MSPGRHLGGAPTFLGARRPGCNPAAAGYIETFPMMKGDGASLLTLATCASGGSYRVVEVRGGEELRRRLAHMGLGAGATLVKLGGQLFRGPILVRVAGTELALGRGMALHVWVEPGVAQRNARHSP